LLTLYQGDLVTVAHSINDSLEEVGMRYSETSGRYSMFVPRDWAARDLGMKYKLLFGPAENGFAINLVFNDVQFNGSIDDLIKADVDVLKEVFLEFNVIEQSEFETLKSLKCKKIVTHSLQNKVNLRQICYYLYRNDGRVMSIVCSMLIENKNVSDEIIDKMINTFEWHTDYEKYDSVFSLDFRNNKKCLEELRANLNNVVPFLGAGISKNYGYPLWDGIVNEIIEAICSSDKSMKNTSIAKAKKKLEEKKYMDTIDILVKNFGRLDVYLEYIMENISNIESKRNLQKNCIDTFGEKLVLFPSKKYLTVNYDTVIENELNANSISKDDIEILTPHDFIRKRSKIADDKFQVYHLHGVYTQQDTLIFSRDDYDDFYGLISEEKMVLRRFGEKIFELYATYCFLFIGYSFNFYQDRLCDILQITSKSPFAKGYHYAFLNTNSVDDLEKKERELIGLKIKVIWYSAELDNNEQHKQAIKALLSSIFNEKTEFCETEVVPQNIVKSEIELFSEVQTFDIPLKYFGGDIYKFSIVVDKIGNFHVTDNGETYKNLDKIFELKEYDVVKNLTAIARIFEKDNLSVVKYGQNNSEYYIKIELKHKKSDAEFNGEVEKAKHTLISCVSFMDNMRIFYE
jgi:hypothetical protein